MFSSYFYFLFQDSNCNLTKSFVHRISLMTGIRLKLSELLAGDYLHLVRLQREHCLLGFLSFSEVHSHVFETAMKVY